MVPAIKAWLHQRQTCRPQTCSPECHCFDPLDPSQPLHSAHRQRAGEATVAVLARNGAAHAAQRGAVHVHNLILLGHRGGVGDAGLQRGEGGDG